MARMAGQLKHGLTIGKDTYTDFELHDHLTAGQIIEAKERAEKVVPFNDGVRIIPTVVESPARLGAMVLCQQIAKLGVFAGPLDYDLLAKLHQDDLDILNLYADLVGGAIDSKELGKRLTEHGLATAPELTTRGRHSGPGGELANDGSQAAQEGPDNH